MSGVMRWAKANKRDAVRDARYDRQSNRRKKVALPRKVSIAEATSRLLARKVS